LKPEFKADAMRLDQTNIKVTKWSEGKPGKASKTTFSNNLFLNITFLFYNIYS
jgi:hypothetical protein